jgi:hypothetical protein
LVDFSGIGCLIDITPGMRTMPKNPGVAAMQWRHAAMSLLLLLASCSQLPSTSSVMIPPVPAGGSRIWLYRNEGPYESHQTPYFRLNDGQPAGISEPNGVLYRDVPPGHYIVSVDSYGVPYPYQYANFDIRAGQEIFIKVVSMRERVGGDDTGIGLRTIFYTWLIPADAARGEISSIPFYGGG